ncbi:MAG: signal peptidase I [Treponema sp.]|nr:signal peptidase I [Treponema sp.]
MNKELFELSYSLKRDFERKVFVAVLFVVGIFAFINIILAYVVFPVRQVSVSMQPDIAKNSCVLFTPLNKSVDRGDVVLLAPRNDESVSFAARAFAKVVSFFTAGQVDILNFSHRMGNDSQIRRVIGIPGDEVYMRDYVMYIKPAGEKYFLTEFELVKKPYNVSINAAPALWDTSIGTEGSFDSRVLGENEYFVLGDSRNSCVDSRLWGALDRNDIRASAIVLYFPFYKMKSF